MSFNTCSEQSLARLKALGWLLWPNSGFCFAGHPHVEILSRNAQLVAFCPKGIAVLSLTRGHSSLPVSCYLCLVLLPVGRSMPWLLSPSTNILVRHGSLDGILQGFLEIASPELWFSRYKKAIISQRQPEISRVCPGSFPSALSQETRGKAAQRDEGGSKGWYCLDWRCFFPLISLLVTICHRNQIKSQSVCSCVLFCVNGSRKKRIPELQKKLFSLKFWHNRSQSLPHSYSNFCISKVCSWAGAYFVIQTWFRWWWIHNLMSYIVLINSMAENFCLILYLNLSVFSIQLQNLIMLLSVRLRCSLHTGTQGSINLPRFRHLQCTSISASVVSDPRMVKGEKWRLAWCESPPLK